MRNRLTARWRKLIARIRRTWSEVDYANRRMFDIRTSQYVIRKPSPKAQRPRSKRRTTVAAR